MISGSNFVVHCTIYDWLIDFVVCSLWIKGSNVQSRNQAKVYPFNSVLTSRRSFFLFISQLHSTLLSHLSQTLFLLYFISLFFALLKIMRNLRLLSETHHVLRQGDQQTHPSFPFTWLTVTPSGAICGGQHDSYTFHENSRDIEHHTIPPEHSHVLGTEFLVAENVLFLATSEGTLLLLWGTETVSLYPNFPRKR